MKAFMLMFLSLFIFKNNCYAKNINKKEYRRAKSIVVNGEYFYPSITSIRERIYFAGNITCSGKIRDKLLSKYCSASEFYCQYDSEFYVTGKTDKNPYIREYFDEFDFFGYKIPFGKCENR